MTGDDKRQRPIGPMQPPPPPEPDRSEPGGNGAEARDSKAERPDPTRFGDWEKNGRCIDF